ncbi:Relaxase/mobilization nuclease [mine drainage metagenome]|uniref:Relaxase/mobilization nuclease n=1 Tax=mine drainage metagenome TaxID=410659 RepID=A0A3P3ZRE7_9ZZZZ
MIPKVVPHRGDGNSSWRQAVEYVSRHSPEREAELDREAGDIDRTAAELARDIELAGRYDDEAALSHPSRDATLRAAYDAELSADGPPPSKARTLSQAPTLGRVGVLRLEGQEEEHAKVKDEAEYGRDPSRPTMFTNCLSVRTAHAEMKAVSDMCSRAKDPVYHTLLSWRPGERPSDAQMFEAGHASMKAVGMEGHQYVFAVHRDTGNDHLHMLINRVNPETYKAVYPSRDFYKLDRVCREVELAQGWEHDKGQYAVIDRDGQKAIVRASKETRMQEKRPTKARDMEEVGGQESLFSYARGEPRQAVAALLKDPRTSWQDLHGELAKHGLELREKGQGLAIYDKTHPERTPIKASDMHEGLGRGKLVKRLGEYQPPIRAIQIEQPARSYDKHREPARDPSRRDQAREERAQARARLRQQYDEWLSEQTKARQQSRAALRTGDRARFTDLTAHHKARREQIRRTDMPAPMRKALYSVAAMEALQAREQLRAELDDKRKAERADRPQNFREWTGDRAQEGDQAAISQLRGWAYADRRRAKELEKAEQENAKKDGITIEAPAGRQEPLSPRRLAMLDQLGYQVDRRTGDVHYQAKERHVFTDSGRRITFSAAGATDREALAAGLALARQKFGQTLTLTGSEQFKDEAIRVTVEKRLDVRLADPALEARRKVLEAARDVAKPHPRERAQERNQVPDKGRGGQER